MKTTTKQVTTSMTFEVTVHLSAIETEDETGADISEVTLEGVEIEGNPFVDWNTVLINMMLIAQKGEWNHE